MADSVNHNIGIVNSWSLLSFASAHGKMQIGDFVNSETGETFKSCIFTDPSNSDNKVFVSFSSKMGVLTPSQISAQKTELQVVELTSGKYSLCRKGENNWADVDL